MPPRRGNEYRLSPAARRDLDGIWDYTVLLWSVEQAETYLRGLAEALQTLLQHPEIARERTEIRPPVRLHRYGSHLIIYRIADDHLAVVRIVHARQHWQALLSD